MRYCRTSSVHHQRVTWRHMRLPFQCTHHDHLNPMRWLLLADHGGWLPRLCQKMHTPPETWQPHPPKTEAVRLYTIPVALRKVGDEHPWPFLPGQRPSKIPDSSRRLLHQVDRSQTISHHYSPTSPIVRLEGYHMSIWRPTYNHHRQWPTIYRQRAC